MPMSLITRLFHALDKDGDGSLEFYDLIHGLAPFFCGPLPAVLQGFYLLVGEYEVDNAYVVPASAIYRTGQLLLELYAPINSPFEEAPEDELDAPVATFSGLIATYTDFEARLERSFPKLLALITAQFVGRAYLALPEQAKMRQKVLGVELGKES